MTEQLYDDSPKPHRGKYFAYLRVSTEKQDEERQRKMITDYLNGGKWDIEWYVDHGLSGKLSPDDRPALQLCIRDAIRNKSKGGNGNIIVAELARFSRVGWHSERFFAEVLSKNKVNLLVADDPMVEEMPLDFKIKWLAQKAHEAQKTREATSANTKQGMAVIKKELESAGFYTTKVGNVIKKLGSPDLEKKSSKARIKASEANIASGDFTVERFWQDIKLRIDSGMSYREIAREFNLKGHYKLPRGGDWYASTIARMVKRQQSMKKRGN